MQGAKLSYIPDSDSERSWSSCCSSCACSSCHSTTEIVERPGEYSTGGDAGLSTGPSTASSCTGMVGGNWTKCPEKDNLSWIFQTLCLPVLFLHMDTEVSRSHSHKDKADTSKDKLHSGGNLIYTFETSSQTVILWYEWGWSCYI